MMKRFLSRLRALLGQSRIRLSPLDVARPELAPGDRVEIGERLWRVVSTRGTERELLALEGTPARAVLRPAGPNGGWTLEDRGERLRLGPHDLVVYPLISGSRPGNQLSTM